MWNGINLNKDIKIEGLDEKTEKFLGSWYASEKRKSAKNQKNIKFEIKANNLIGNIIKETGVNISSVITVNKINIETEKIISAYNFKDDNNKDYLVIFVWEYGFFKMVVACKEYMKTVNPSFIVDDYKKFGPFTKVSYIPVYREVKWDLGRNILKKYYDATSFGEIPNNIEPTYEEMPKKVYPVSFDEKLIDKKKEVVKRKVEEQKENTEYKSHRSSLTKEQKLAIMTANVAALGYGAGTSLNYTLFKDDDENIFKR